MVALAGGERVAKPTPLFLNSTFLQRRKTVRLSKKLAALTIVSVSVAGLAGGAFAFWTTAGSGSGSATAASDYSNRIVVNQLVSASGLVPGGAAQPMSGDFGSAGINRHGDED